MNRGFKRKQYTKHFYFFVEKVKFIIFSWCIISMQPVHLYHVDGTMYHPVVSVYLVDVPVISRGQEIIVR